MLTGQAWGIGIGQREGHSAQPCADLAADVERLDEEAALSRAPVP